MSESVNSPTLPSPSPRLGLAEKIGYGAGDFASCLYFGIFMNFLAFYYTDVFGISAAAVGTMIFITRTWDWINDPIMGAICDRTNTRMGKFRPWILWMIPPYMIIGILTFTSFDLSENGKIIYAFVTYTALTMVYTAINIPYGALMGVMSPKSSDRIELASFRFVGAYAGTSFVTGTLVYLVSLFGGGDQQLGYTLTVTLYAFLAGAMFYFTFAATKERVAPPAAQKSDLKKELKALLHNGPWCLMIVLSIVTIISTAIRMGSTMHYYKYVTGSETWGANMLFINSIASMLIVIFTKHIAKLFRGKKRAFVMINFIGAGYLSLFYLLPQVFWIHAIYWIVLAILMAPLMPLFWAMIADTADYGAVKLGQRSTGLLFSAGTFSQKIGWSIGPAIALWILAFSGFQANETQSPGTVHTLRLMVSFIPGAVAALAGVVALFYKIDGAMERELEQQINAQSAEASTSAAQT